MSALPLPGARWVASRKEALIRAIDAGTISEAEACARYRLSVEELADWRAGLALDGRRGLMLFADGARRRSPERRP